MLKIYTHKETQSAKQDIKVPWDRYFIEHKVSKYIDDTDVEIVNNVENTSIINNNTIQGKFSNMPIGIGCLSEGCKTLLCINHAKKTNTINKYIFNITSCGGNAISYLAEQIARNVDIFVYVAHSDFGMSENANIQIDDGEIIRDALTASNIHMKILRGI